MPLAQMELLSPGSVAGALPACIPVHSEDEAGPDAPCGVQRQSLWGWGAGTARLSQLGEVHLTHWVLGETLLRLRGWAQGRDHTLEAVPVT